jgi:hypothetical protein
MFQGRTAKQQRSEQKRALAIEEKRTLNSKKSNPNISAPQGTHTVFESGSDSDTDLRKALKKKAKVKKKINGSYEKKITGKAADRWLGFSSADDDDDDVHVNTIEPEPGLPSKPQFEGKHGEKLMRLQRQIGQDKRFEVTSAFLEESSDGSSDEQEHEENDFEKEKNMSLAVLQSLMGSIVCTGRDKEIRNKRKLMDVQRYDPDDERCADLEIKPDTRLPVDDVKNKKKLDKNPITIEHPVVSEDRFYSVSSELDFSNDKQTHSFSFFSMPETQLETEQEEIDSSTTGDNTKISKRLQTKKSLLQQLDSSSDEERKVKDDEQTQQIEEVQENVDSDNGFFFLYDSSGDLKGRLADGVRHFMRTETVEELESKWKLKRKFLLQDYKKKRKDALRRLKRLRAHQHTPYKK